MKKTAKNFGYSAKNISTERAAVLRQARATFDIERFELKHTSIAS